MRLSSAFAPVPRLRRPGAREFAWFVRRRLPVVIEGALDGWRACSTWSFDRLRQMAPKLVVRVQSRNSERAIDFEYRDITFDQLIDSIQSGDGRDYLASSALLEAVPALSNDIEAPRYARGRTLPPRLFIGPKGSFSPLHYDLGHGLSGQIVGKKRIVVVEFRRRDFALHPDLRGPGLLSEVIDPEREEPRIENITPSRRWLCTAHPGDLVFLPGRRHHFVRSLENTISVSFFWYPLAERAIRKLLAMAGKSVV